MRKREWICNEQGCPERKEVCKEHKDKNLVSLEKHAENLAKQNLEFVFTCVNNKALITRADRKRKSDSRSIMNDDRPLLVKTKKRITYDSGGYTQIREKRQITPILHEYERGHKAPCYDF